jgi:hypothetical protein
MEQTLMTESAATPTEGQTATQGAETQTAQIESSTVAADQAQQQPAEQAADSASKSDAEQAAADEKAGDAEGKPEGAPEKYELQTPEGMQFDDQVVGAFSEVAKDLGLSQEAAQKILDKVGPVMAERQAETLTAASKEWAEASKADKEFGGDKLNENLAVAKKAMDQFASPELRTLLNESALGNNPEVIRMFYRVGKAISEDGFVVGGNARNSEQSAAQRMYPNMNP